jgi:prepilin-type N-terminal cleavage/methylation domain-containing protein
MAHGTPGTALDMVQVRDRAQAGFTLVEIVVVVAIVVTTALAGIAISLGSRSFAVATAASEFDHIIDSARTIARETQGATLVFTPDVFGDGTEVRVLTPGPNGTLSPTTVPTLHTRATIDESESLGKAPFAFVVHATGALGGRPGYRTGNPNTIPEVGCPASGRFHFTIHTAGATAERTLPCRITLAATGPLALTGWPAASPAPLPTPCTSGPCAPIALPTAPSSSPTCPPSFNQSGATCVPGFGSSSSATYHVTAAVGSANISVGNSTAITAQAVLTNAGAAPNGSPATIPVQAVSDANCSVSPTTPQPSSATFQLVAISPGNCSITVTADTSSVAGATADSASVQVAVTAPPSPPSTTCDLVQDGACYIRLIGPTAVRFEKDVMPSTQCDQAIVSSSCVYVNSIQQITLTPYYFVPPVAPDTAQHAILFKIDSVHDVNYGCVPYESFVDVPPPNPLPYASTGVGGPNNPAAGFGNPSLYVRQNFVYVGEQGVGNEDDTATSRNVGSTLSNLVQTIARKETGTPYSFTYFTENAVAGDFVNWFPDYPGCDAVGDPNISDPQFGYSSVTLIAEIFQRIQ